MMRRIHTSRRAASHERVIFDIHLLIGGSHAVLFEHGAIGTDQFAKRIADTEEKIKTLEQKNRTAEQ